MSKEYRGFSLWWVVGWLVAILALTRLYYLLFHATKFGGG